ncbi:cupin domain-containing protein [Solitalea sp. MAHUQ-68]|uniref:Cupin domain-containing protein n=1 Tax=Solitalea agri TaxID=2953739 RepID=A0A9X2F5V2_9SPHI|nr:cupin domain-containing protein [Solitalea agri]MCO4291373.1 cupin domain-containing protein [Solitalea agri]
MEKSDPIISRISTTDGEELSVAKGKYRILIGGEQTNGSYAVIEMRVPPNGGPAPHSHNQIQESFYVAEGEIEFSTESGKLLAGKGDFINIPLDGGAHAFKNISDTDALLICTVIPAGLDSMFKEISKVASPEDARSIGEKKYGIRFYPPNFLD